MERTECARGYIDSHWADRVLGAVDARQAAQMDAHLAECAVCRERCAEWRRLLGRDVAGPIGAAGPAGGAFGAPGDSADAAYPGEWVRRSLVRKVRRLGRKRSAPPRGVLLGSAAAAVVLFLLVAGLLRQSGPSSALADPADVFMLRQEPAAERVLQAADTSHYRIVTAAQGYGRGYAWISGDASEALLLLDGLPALEQVDYQAWAVGGGNRESLGLLKISGGRAHLHVRTATLRTTENITLSAEPKGGSEQPTSAETLLVMFRNYGE